MKADRSSSLNASTGRRWLVASMALFVISRLILLVDPWPHVTDVHLYFDYAREAAESGMVPYRDFTVEYPPLAWHLIALTERLTSSTGDLSYARFRHWFHVLMAVCDVVALVLFWSIARRRAGAWHGPLCFSFVVVTCLCGYVLYERLDLGLLALLLAWAFAWLKSLSGQRHAQAWSLASYALLGLGVCYKLVPLVMAPYLLFCQWRQGGLSRLAPALAVFTLTMAITFVPLYPTAGNKQFGFLEFHRNRGIQVESIYATALSLAACVGFPFSVIEVYCFDEVVSPWTPALKMLSRWLLLGLYGISGLWALLQSDRFQQLPAYRLACFVLLGTVVLSNVLSPQYFIWVIPVAMLLAVELPPGPARQRPLLLAALIAIGALTLLEYPLAYPELVKRGRGPDPTAASVYLAEAIVGVRNFALLALTIWLGAQMVNATRSSSPPRPLPPAG